MALFLVKLLMLEAFVCILSVDYSSSLPCSPNSWIQFPGASVSQTTSVAVSASNVTDCQSKCLANNTCFGVAWNATVSACYFNLDPTNNIGIDYLPGQAGSTSTYYGLIRNYSSCDKNNYNCSLTWIGVKDFHGFGASQNDRKTVIDCIQWCQDNLSCVVAEWNYQENSCWVYPGMPPYPSSQFGIYQFTRNCTNGLPSTTGRTRPTTPGPNTTTSTSTSTSTVTPTTQSSSSTTMMPTKLTSPQAPRTSGPSSSFPPAAISISTISTISTISIISTISTISTVSTISTSTSQPVVVNTTSASVAIPQNLTTSSYNSTTSYGPNAAAQMSNDWYPLAIKPAYIVLAGVGGGCILMVITAVVILCEYSLNKSFYSTNGSAPSTGYQTHHQHQQQQQQQQETSDYVDARDDAEDMDMSEMDVDKKPYGNAEEFQRD